MDILAGEGRLLPKGFGEDDFNLEAPRLYNDMFYFYYYFSMIRLGLTLNSISLTASTRPDIRAFYQQCCISTMRFWDKCTDIMLAKGLAIRPPYIRTARSRDFIKSQSFLTGFLGERRPLLAREVEHLYFNLFNNIIGKYLLTGFRQVARSEKVRSIMSRGINMADKFIKSFSSTLKKEDIPIPQPVDIFITDSSMSPLSDKLMMFHTLSMGGIGIGNYAASMAGSMRHDITAKYTRIIAEAAGFAEDGINIMIENGWFEEPPRTIDRRELVNEPKH